LLLVIPFGILSTSCAPLGTAAGTSVALRLLVDADQTLRLARSAAPHERGARIAARGERAVTADRPWTQPGSCSVQRADVTGL
jgi:hypothetical protein